MFDKSNNFHPSSQLQIGELKMILHGTISKDDFQRKTALQCWNNVVTIRNNVATMLQRCVVQQEGILYAHASIGAVEVPQRHFL